MYPLATAEGPAREQTPMGRTKSSTYMATSFSFVVTAGSKQKMTQHFKNLFFLRAHPFISRHTPQGNSGCQARYKNVSAWVSVLQTSVLRNNVADIIPISWCPSGGVETSVIYLHNDCIHLCGNVLSWAVPTGQITRVVVQSHSWNGTSIRGCSHTPRLCQ